MEKLKIEYTGEGMSVVLPSEIDHHAASSLRVEIDARLREEHPDELILDMRNVTFMDSSGLGLVLGRYTKCNAVGIKVKIINPSARVYSLLRMAGLEKKILIIQSS